MLRLTFGTSGPVRITSTKWVRRRSDDAASLRCGVTLLLMVMLIGGSAVHAVQAEVSQEQEVNEKFNAEGEGVPSSPDEVEVEPVAEDIEIAQRLQNILQATGWFEEPTVRVDEGIVFAAGSAITPQHKEWAERLASKTEGVVAVVNHISIKSQSMWELSPTLFRLREIADAIVQHLPLAALAVLMLWFSWMAAKHSVTVTSFLLRRRLRNELLLQVGTNVIAMLVFLLGLYLVLQVSGLTRLAVTVLGGTGLIGLVIGIAFRDITENLLASILLSAQHPFRTGDLIEIEGQKGYVQRVTMRGTLLMTLEGNHVQIPNATVYKQTIKNFTTNPNERCQCAVGIGYENSIADAQRIALGVLHNHPMVLEDPEPLVLAESLGAATVNLRIFFWVNCIRNSTIKLNSAVIRLVKLAYQQNGISMPDEARETLFPEGICVRMDTEGPLQADEQPRIAPRYEISEREAVSASSAEGNLRTESDELREQAAKVHFPDMGPNLLDDLDTESHTSGES